MEPQENLKLGRFSSAFLGQRLTRVTNSWLAIPSHILALLEHSRMFTVFIYSCAQMWATR